MYMRRQTPAADSALATGSRGHDEAWPSEGTFLDSRLRGNDSGGCRESFLPMVWLSSPSPLSSPVEGEEIGLGVQRGKAPLPRVWGCPPTPFFYSPKIEDPPQEEWGIEGVDSIRLSATRKKHGGQNTDG